MRSRSPAPFPLRGGMPCEAAHLPPTASVLSDIADFPDSQRFPVSGLIAIAYVSTAVCRPMESELESLLADARSFNAKAGVTGALLLHEVTFFQYLEGPPEGVRSAYARVKAARMHEGIIELVDEPIAARHFPDWQMGFATAPQSLVLQLSQAQWRHTRATFEGQPDLPQGIDVLMAFWLRSRGQI